MQQITPYEPIFFERNRVKRVYSGGKLFAELLGDEPADGFYPEEWICSSVKALNSEPTSPTEGLSFIRNTQTTFADFILQYPHEMLGNRKNFDVLVKFLDSAIRLPLQAHPDISFSQKNFNSSFGKTEMWLILATRENAKLFFGFNRKISKEEFSEQIEKSAFEPNILEGLLQSFTPKPGEVYLIPPKAVHAIGYGCLILEVQEPTDFTIQPEYYCGEKRLTPYEMYLGLDKETALECFDMNIFGKDCIQFAKKSPVIREKKSTYCIEKLIDFTDTPCFAVNRYTVEQTTPIYFSNSAPALYIVTKGNGYLEGTNGCRQPLKKGDYFFLPYVCSGKYGISSISSIECIECLPPKH